MEASEKTQMPLDIDAAEGSVRLVEDRIVIEHVEISDQGTARILRDRFREGEEPVSAIRRAIEIGTRVLDREDTAVEVDYIKRQFEQVTDAHREAVQAKNEEIAARLEETERRLFGDDESDGVLGTALDAHTEGLAEQIASTFGEDRDGAVQTQIQRMLEERDEKFMRRISANDEDNPLRPIIAAISQWTKERKEGQDERDDKIAEKLDETLNQIAELTGLNRGSEALAEAEEAGTRKGRSFEDRVDKALEAIAATRGDASSHTGGEGAEGGGKKGDTLIELGAADGPSSGRIIFEAKDAKRLTKNEAWAQLNGAMGARAASFGVLVVAGDEKVPAGRETLTEYEGNKMIVAVDRDEPAGLALEVAYRLAAARVTMARDRDMTVDAPAVRDAAEEAVSCLKTAQGIRSALTGIKTSSDKARTSLDEMVANVEERLMRVESLVEAVESEPDA